MRTEHDLTDYQLLCSRVSQPENLTPAAKAYYEALTNADIHVVRKHAQCRGIPITSRQSMVCRIVENFIDGSTYGHEETNTVINEMHGLHGNSRGSEVNDTSMHVDSERSEASHVDTVGSMHIVNISQDSQDCESESD